MRARTLRRHRLPADREMAATGTPAAARRRLGQFLRHLAPGQGQLEDSRAHSPLQKAPVWNRGPVELAIDETVILLSLSLHHY